MKIEEKRSYYIETLQLLLKLRLEEKINPLFLIIEEAENLKGETLDQVVAEGRKIGVFACLLTTHAADLGGKILSQIISQIIGKTIIKEDIEYLISMSGTTNALPSLGVGEWIINRLGDTRPMKVQVS